MQILCAKLNAETAKIPWKELQLFFARGVAIYVCPSLDLVRVASDLSNDDIDGFERWTKSGRIARVTDEQATAWFNSDNVVWAVVVKPWVLVQPIRAEDTASN